MKVAIKQIRLKSVEVEVPATCECGGQFQVAGSPCDLRATTLEDAERRAVIMMNGELSLGGLEPDGHTEIEAVWALSCGNCGKVVASEPPRATPTTGATVPVACLTPEERTLLVNMIDAYGTGEHPAPSPGTLKDFSADYAWTCAAKALGSGKLTKQGAEIGRSLARVLEATVHGEVSSWR